MSTPARIIDAHVHFYDVQQNRHAFLESVDAGYEAFVGNYDALPRRYLLSDYLADTRDYRVEGVVWHEFLSDDPWQEASWAQQRADASGVRHALVAMVDFLDPDLERKLDRYETLPNLTAVREHLVWDPSNPLKRFAKRPDLLDDPAWRRQLNLLNGRRLKCGLEVFAHQLPALTEVIDTHPQIGFTVAVMGWPLDLSQDGFNRWRKDLAELASCDNICVDISALECIFGMHWTKEQVEPWVHAALDSFGVSRCMLGSHMPIAKLSTGFDELYARYAELFATCSVDERDALFYRVANDWFKPA
jgi:predicted TIM-barrel fold metal-dependent hydrolase